MDSEFIEEIVDVKKYVTKFDLSGLFEIETGYELTDNLDLSLSFLVMHSITEFSNSSYFNGFNLRHYGGSINLGLKYILD